MPKPSNTCKALREMFLDFKTTGEYGILLSRGTGLDDVAYIHKAFNCSMWADGVAKYFYAFQVDGAFTLVPIARDRL